MSRTRRRKKRRRRGRRDERARAKNKQLPIVFTCTDLVAKSAFICQCAACHPAFHRTAVVKT